MATPFQFAEPHLPACGLNFDDKSPHSTTVSMPANNPACRFHSLVTKWRDHAFAGRVPLDPTRRLSHSLNKESQKQFAEALLFNGPQARFFFRADASLGNIRVMRAH
jgi:hypothetical protein